jgi:hypothetical protein
MTDSIRTTLAAVDDPGRVMHSEDANVGVYPPRVIVEFQNRLLVFIQWAIQDITFSRGARLITGVAPTDFNFNHAVAAEERAVKPAVEKKNEPAVA